jgi:hypothetical protein
MWILRVRVRPLLHKTPEEQLKVCKQYTEFVY